MRVIHFTRGATDPLAAFDARGASFLPLADGQGDTHISCLHLEMGGKIAAPSITHAAALLIVHGRVTVEPDHGARIDFSGGMGAVFGPNEPIRRQRRQLPPPRRGIWRDPYQLPSP